jgi:hypothetical protein
LVIAPLASRAHPIVLLLLSHATGSEVSVHVSDGEHTFTFLDAAAETTRPPQLRIVDPQNVWRTALAFAFV